MLMSFLADVDITVLTETNTPDYVATLATSVAYTLDITTDIAIAVAGGKRISLVSCLDCIPVHITSM